MSTRETPQSNEQLLDLISPTTTADEIKILAEAVPSQSQLGRKRLLIKMREKLGDNFAPLDTLHTEWTKEDKLPIPWATH